MTFDPVAFVERRNRLRNPPNAVEDQGINLRKSARGVKGMGPFRLVDPVPKPAEQEAQPEAVEEVPTVEELPTIEDPRLTIRKIQDAVCEVAGIARTELLSQRRATGLVRSRHAAMWLCKDMTAHSLPEIGRRFLRDHTTVLYATRKVEARKDEYITIIDRVREHLGASKLERD